MGQFDLKKLLTRIGYIVNPELGNCELIDAFFDPDSKEISLKIKFPEVPRVSLLVDFNTSVKTGLLNNNFGKNVTIDYIYQKQELDADSVQEYYRYILEILKGKKFAYKCLDNFAISFANEEIVLSIGEGNDEKYVRPLYEMVQKSFSQLGLSFIKFSLIVTPFIAPVSHSISLSREEDLKNVNLDAKTLGKTSEKTANDSTDNNTKGHKPPKNTQKINRKPNKIIEIPTTESGLVEHNQKNGDSEFVVEGVILSSKVHETKGGYKIYDGVVADDTDAISIKTFISERSQTQEYYETKASEKNKVKIYGYADYDKYSKDIVLKIKDIISYDKVTQNAHRDNALEKRVELHAHSKMTFIDSVLSIEEYLTRALEYDHRAIALTDKNSLQGFGQLAHAIESEAKNNPKAKEILPIYGMEGFVVDENSFKIALTDENINLSSATFVVYDFETTGLSPYYDDIIEIGACKIQNGRIVDEFQEFVNPKRSLSKLITELTNITNDHLRGAKTISEVLPRFVDFYKGSILVAHNAGFDNSHLLRNLKTLGLYQKDLPTIDTLNLARIRYSKKLKRFGLEDLCKAFGVSLEQHHRACDDAVATGQVFIKMLNDLLNDNINNYKDINTVIDTKQVYKEIYPFHVTILSKNRTGLVNLNRIVTDAHCNHFGRGPLITKEVLNCHREGLLVGSGCYHGEIFNLAFKGCYQEMLERADFYDYFEVLPVDAYKHLLEEGRSNLTIENIHKAIELIIKLGKETKKIVVATGDVHELDPEDKLYRNILYDKALIGGGIHEFNRLENLPSQHFRTTNDMLSQFNFLSNDVAYEIVVTNTNKIADMIERYDVFPKKLFAPGDDFMADFGVPSAKEAVREITYQNARQRYGVDLPRIIDERLQKELDSIIGNGYASIYYISYCLVKYSTDAGYIVGSRGSIGSSLVATFMHITEVNALTPHYICDNCKFSAFKYSKGDLKKYKPSDQELAMQEVLAQHDSGFDLPPHKCPICGSWMDGDGFNIPFETFLGFDGDKIPDIDLNFSGEYQAKAHAYCREIFGEENTFRGGTIGTIALKTAERYVNDYYMKREKVIRRCQMSRLATKLIGIKRQTGQHPGGIVVVPKGIDINEVTAVQYPADDLTNPWKTTHIDYHKFEANLLKLDILGHDDPTMIRFLMSFVEKSPHEFSFSTVEGIPINDREILKLFNGVEVIGVNSKVIKTEVASNGLPEFGTKLTKEMLTEIRPNSISELIKISGLSHGENVWSGNARNYFLGLDKTYGKIPFDELIGCRDDIMSHLIAKGVSEKDSFVIMERVRKGKGISSDQEKTMKKHGVAGWFIESCKAIAYLFPKAHATAYVIMALRIAWFKLYKPLYYYSGFFSKRIDAFDVATLSLGIEAISKKIDELSKTTWEFSGNIDESQRETFGNSALEETSEVKANKMLVGLQVALEMVARGYKFLGVHVNNSDATDFVIEGDALRIPLIAIDSLGETTAKQIISNRGDVPFTSIKDVVLRGKVSTKMIEKFQVLNALEGLPKEDEIGLFKYLKEEYK